MGIADKHFGAEIMTKKGKVFKFDDMHCVLGFLKANTINNKDIKETYLVNFNEPHDFLIASKAFLLKSEELKSPMGGNIAAFSNDKQLQEARQKFKGEAVTWTSLNSEN
jgi:copper chaperone NosL